MNHGTRATPTVSGMISTYLGSIVFGMLIASLTYNIVGGDAFLFLKWGALCGSFLGFLLNVQPRRLRT